MGINVSAVCDKYDFEITGASYIGKPKNNTVMFIAKKIEHLLTNLNGVENSLVFAQNTIDVPKELTENNCIILTDNPQRDYASFAQKLADQRRVQDAKRKVVLCEGGYYIGENVEIGEGTMIEPLCYIGHDVKIGKNATILTGAKIKRAIIGDGFIAGENAIIGTFGFTMANDEQGNKIRIPTLGKVIIGNNVEVGGLSNVSVGSGGDTVLEDNVKLDVLVHIGHDVHLGKNVEITAGAIIGGFVDMAAGAYVGINAVLRNRINIGADTTIGMGAVVTKTIEPGITVAGNPAKPFERNK